ncbi:MAG TPA: HNH endonuclease [Verrucomicrobiae bacterium]|jgi:putative restriction endonuclease|nr:HNH endonuclease [Verrucomicrobiae bacterium]
MDKLPYVRWTREHSLIALNLYCKLPFGKLHKRNPIIMEIASKMGRTASSLAMKLCNFASLDPVQRARGIQGLSGASRQDTKLWNEFQTHITELGVVSEELMHDLFTKDQEKEVDFLESGRIRITPPAGPTEILRTAMMRRGQQFFRQTVLTAYSLRCCISGIGVPRLLVASHIRPWRDFPSERLDPCNGLCLSALHDAAFDSGLITLDEKLKVILSTRLKSFLPQVTLEQNFVPFEGKRIEVPQKFTEPCPEFLRYHREKIFED